MSAQHDLFGGSTPVGWTYRDELIDAAEEQALLSTVAAWPLVPAKYKDYTARRKVLSFGGSFDYSTNTLQPAEPIPAALAPLRARVAHWAGLAPEAFAHALVAYYAPGTPLGWHRDVPDWSLVSPWAAWRGWNSVATRRCRGQTPFTPTCRHVQPT